MIKTILWDIDDTLLDFKKAENNSLKNTFRHFGLGECSDEMVFEYSKINQHHWEELEKGNVTKDEVLKNRFTDFFKLMNITGVDEVEFCEYYENGLADKIFFIDGAVEVLKALSSEYKQYAVTNGAKNIQQARLRKSELDAILDGAFISDSVGFEKPSAEFFNVVLENIEPCCKDEIIIIGDSLTSDMLGGNNAGIITCWHNPYSKKNTKGVSIAYEIKSLSDIFEVLKQMNSKDEVEREK